MELTSMGRLDLAMKMVMKDLTVFTDTFNFCRINGSKIDPSRLREMDPSVYMVEALSGDVHSQTSDLAKRLVICGDESRTCALLLLENQAYVDLLMPLRCLYATALHLREEADIIRKRHKMAQDLKDTDAFLSGFSPIDRLPHVYMLILYAGNKPWNGPLRLSELFSEEDAGCGLYEADCRLNLISLVDLSAAEIARFNTNEMKVMATAIQLQDDPLQLLEVAQTNPAFVDLDAEMYNVVHLTSGFELPPPTHPKENDMKKDLTAVKEILRKEGAEEKSATIVANMLMKKCPLTMIEDYIQISRDKILQIAKANNIPIL